MLQRAGAAGSAGVLAARALREGRRAERGDVGARDAALDALAENVREIAREARDVEDLGMPVILYAPLQFAFEAMSLTLVRTYGLAARLGVPEEEARELIRDYLFAWIIEMTAALDVDRFVGWADRIRERERGAHANDGGAAANGHPEGDQRPGESGGDTGGDQVGEAER